MIKRKKVYSPVVEREIPCHRCHVVRAVRVRCAAAIERARARPCDDCKAEMRAERNRDDARAAEIEEALALADLGDELDAPAVSTHQLPPRPTQHRPGTPGKIVVMARRAAAGYAIFHPRDTGSAVYRSDVLREIAED